MTNKPPRRTHQQIQAEWLALLQPLPPGLTISEMARRIGKNYSDTRYHALRLGFAQPPSGMALQPFSQKRRQNHEKWHALLSALPPGLTISDMARRLGKHHETIKQNVLRHNIPYLDGRPRQGNWMPPEQRARYDAVLKAGLASGQTLIQIGRELGGISRERVRQLYKNRGWVKPRALFNCFVRTVNPVDPETIRAGLLSGMSLPEIGAKLGIHGATVASIARHFGFTRPNSKALALERFRTRGECWCNRCRVFKPVAAFSKDRTRFTGLGCYCKACSAAATRQWTLRRREARARDEAGQNVR